APVLRPLCPREKPHSSPPPLHPAPDLRNRLRARVARTARGETGSRRAPEPRPPRRVCLDHHLVNAAHRAVLTRRHGSRPAATDLEALERGILAVEGLDHVEDRDLGRRPRQPVPPPTSHP